MQLNDWEHGNEGTGIWTEDMPRERIIVGGPALRLDASIFSNMRPHRAAAPPVGMPVVKLFAVVRLNVGSHQPNNDAARFGSLEPPAPPHFPQGSSLKGSPDMLSSPKKARTVPVITSAPSINGSASQGRGRLVTDQIVARDPAPLFVATPAPAPCTAIGSPDSLIEHGMPLQCVREEESGERDRIQGTGRIKSFDADFSEALDKFKGQIKRAQARSAQFTREYEAEKLHDKETGWKSPPVAFGMSCAMSVSSGGSAASPDRNTSHATSGSESECERVTTPPPAVNRLFADGNADGPVTQNIQPLESSSVPGGTDPYNVSPASETILLNLNLPDEASGKSVMREVSPPFSHARERRISRNKNAATEYDATPALVPRRLGVSTGVGSKCCSTST